MVVNAKRIEERAIEVFGKNAQTLKLIEELGELATAASRYLNIKNFPPEEHDKIRSNFKEECADVEILLKQMRIIHGDIDIDKWYAMKIVRLDLALKELEND